LSGQSAVDAPLVTSSRGESQLKAFLVELVRFSRRNTLSALGGVVGGLIIIVALTAPLLAPRDPLTASPPEDDAAADRVIDSLVAARARSPRASPTSPSTTSAR